MVVVSISGMHYDKSLNKSRCNLLPLLCISHIKVGSRSALPQCFLGFSNQYYLKKGLAKKFGQKRFKLRFGLVTASQTADKCQVLLCFL